MVQKKCTTCGELKNLSAFYPHKDCKYGVHSSCKECDKQRIKLSSVYYRRTDGYKKSRLAYRQSKKWKATCSRWWKTDKGKACAARARAAKRTRYRTTVNSLTAEQWRSILLVQDNSCGICGVSFVTTRPERDHILPISRGGGLTKNNVQALCRSCNSSKGDKTMEEYLVWKGNNE